MFFDLEDDQMKEYKIIIKRATKFDTSSSTNILKMNVKYPKIRTTDMFIKSLANGEKDIDLVNKLFQVDLYVGNQINKNTIANDKIVKKKNALCEMYKKANVIESVVYPSKYTSSVADYRKHFVELMDDVENRKLYRGDVLILSLPKFKEKKIGKVGNNINNNGNDINNNGNDINNIKDEDVFKFKNQVECNTRQTSANYYYSKKDIIDIISGNVKIKARFPANYKSLGKKDICKILFDK